MADLLAAYGDGFHGFKKGQTVTGRLARVSGKEILIDFGGKTEGIVGEKEYDDIRNFIESLKIGDKVDAVVISSENDRGQMVVSVRKAGHKFRWQRADDLLKSAEAVNVRGMEVNKGGLVVDFEGVKGFIPSSQLTQEHAQEMSRLINKTLSAKVIEVDQKQNRLIFSERSIVNAADLVKKLEDVKSKVKANETHSGVVSAIMPYGIFVNLDNGTDGLVHISEISWQKVENLADTYKIGDKVEVFVIGVNDQDAKLNLSIKKLLPDPWLDLAKKYNPEQQIKGVITRVSPYGLFVKLEEGIEGLIHISKVPAESDFKVADEVTCTIESIDTNSHRISLIPVVTYKPIGYK